MKKLILFVLVFITLQSNVIAATAAAIGDSIHAIHYTINIDEINTSDKTINGWAEVIITPKINQRTKMIRTITQMCFRLSAP